MVDDLVDQYRLLVFPTLLGKGRRLFDAVSAPVELELVSMEDAGGGAIRQVYNRRRSCGCPKRGHNRDLQVRRPIRSA